MINGLGIVGWGVGGIEAEAGMLGQPVYFLTPDVVGVHMTGRLAEGVTATDLALHCTQMLRAAKVVGKFVEFHGEGAASLPLPDRATIANMAPEYGATMGFFPVDEESCNYLLATGRPPEHVDAFRAYFKAQGPLRDAEGRRVRLLAVLELDLSTVRPSVAGPKRPQDRIDLPDLKEQFRKLLEARRRERLRQDGRRSRQRHPTQIGFHGTVPEATMSGGGHQDPTGRSPPPRGAKDTNPWTETEMVNNRPSPDRVEDVPEEHLAPAVVTLGHGDVLIAAITSCTNTSNPSVMLAAGLLAKKAVERGLSVSPKVKASLAPGSRVVTEYLARTRACRPYLDQLGFNLVGYGCTTCIGNSGPLDPAIEEVVTSNDLIAASVLSGNRNFEARVQQNIKANFLMSPPLVVAFALAGRVDIDLTSEPLGRGRDGRDVYLRDIWPSLAEVQDAIARSVDPATYRRLYSDFVAANPLWNEIPSASGKVYQWDPNSTYIQEPPFFDRFQHDPGRVCDIRGARALAIFGDSVTTDHISPAGAIKKTSPAGLYLQEKGVAPEDFNSYGSRRGNDRVMTRGTFANVRIKNLMVPGVEGGVTVHQPDGEQMSIYDAAIRYQAGKIPLVVFAGQEYGLRQLPRLGGEGHAPARRARRHRAELRAHPPLEPRRHGRPPLPVHRWRERANRSASTAPRPSTSPGLEGGLPPRQTVDLTIRRAGRHREGPRSSSASTRRSRSTTTATAASCRTSCASCRRRPSPSSARARFSTPASAGPSIVPGLDDAAGRPLPAGVPRGAPERLLLGPLPYDRSRDGGLASALPAFPARRRHLLLRHPRPGRGDGRPPSSSATAGPQLPEAGALGVRTWRGSMPSTPRRRSASRERSSPACARPSGTAPRSSGSRARPGRSPPTSSRAAARSPSPRSRR